VRAGYGRVEAGVNGTSQEARQFPRAGLATPHYLASAAGAEILARGGNALDAAVAANLALGVVAPYLCGYGGDLFAMVWDGQLHGYQSAGRAPAAASIDALRAAGVAEMPVFGPHTVTVPGAVRGWFALAKRWGTMTFAELAAPARRLAEHGFPLTAFGAGAFAMVRRSHRNDPWSGDLVAAYARERTQPGSVLAQPALARTIELLVREGPDAFYRGPIGDAIARAVQRHGGLLSTGDLADHDGAFVEPLLLEHAGCTVAQLPPPTQGVTALEMLAIYARAGGAELGDDAGAHHLAIEAAKLGLADRDAFVGDPEAMAIDPASLLQEPFVAERARAIDPARAARPRPVAGPDGGTAYLCSADAGGLAVSLIQSNFASIGAGIHVPEWGINLQNRGSSFRLDREHPNALAPRRLPMHTLIPAMVLREGRPSLVFGTMGGHGQAQTHLQVLTRLLVDGAELQAAITHPRWIIDPWHWRVDAESRFPAALLDALAARGHEVRTVEPYDHAMGHAHAIALAGGGVAVATDPRTEGAAVGL
jgi:gamma-glutamyltranspeptidase/glutathione hydrolase